MANDRTLTQMDLVKLNWAKRNLIEKPHKVQEEVWSPAPGVEKSHEQHRWEDPPCQKGPAHYYGCQAATAEKVHSCCE